MEWVIADIGRMSGDDWRALVAGADVVVNAAGALQDGARDDLVAVHVTAVERMLAALAGSGTRVVQISAAGVRAEAEAETAFFATKAQGDAALMRSGLDWVVLRPVLVLAPAAYGGRRCCGRRRCRGVVAGVAGGDSAVRACRRSRGGGGGGEGRVAAEHGGGGDRSGGAEPAG
ncbi:MAG: NAD(P)H-binding protein [Paracoccaceae bacterium]